VSDPGTSRSMAVPDTVHGVLAARIDRLAEAPKRLLQTASILGREFPARLLSALWDGGGLAPHLHELTRQEFVYERAGADERTYVFKHALTQDVAESTVLTARRRELHRRAADALLRLYPGRRDELAPVLAHHYAEAETWTPAAEYATRAAEAASAAYANREALARYDQALTAAERARLPALDRLRLHAARGHVHERLGEFPAACGDLEAALALARDDGRDSACAEMLGALAELWGGHKDYQRGQELAAEAVRAAEVAGDRRVLADALVRDGLMALNLGRTGRSRRALEQALAIFRETADDRGYAKTLDVLAMAEGVGGDIARAIEDGREAIARYEALGERMALTSVLSTVGIWLVYGGDVREGEAMLRRAVDAAVAVGTRSQEAFAHMALAQRGLMYGGMTAARHEAETAYRIAREIDHREWMSGALSVLGGIQRECGDVAGARRTHEEMIGIARELGGALWLAGGLAELALDTVALGDLETAGRSAEEAETVAAEAAEFLALAWLARAALALVGERWDDVLGLVRRIRTDARQFRVLVAEASQFEGAALARLGHPAEAEAVLRAGQSEASAIAAQPAHARLGFALADVLDARGRPDEAAAERTAAQAVRARALA